MYHVVARVVFCALSIAFVFEHVLDCQPAMDSGLQKYMQIRKLLARKFFDFDWKKKGKKREICHTGGKFGQIGGKV